MRLLRRAALQIPAIRRLLDSRDRLVLQLADMNSEMHAAMLRANALSAAAATQAGLLRTHGNDTAAMQSARQAREDDTAAMWKAREESRLFITEYPYFPASRRLEHSSGGQQLAARFQRDSPAIIDTITGVARHAKALGRIPREQVGALGPFWANDWFPPFDGAALYGLIAEHAPRRYIEVGSGISTRFARQAIRDLGLPTRIVSIDPHPHNATEGLCDETIVQRMEDLPGDFWSGLTAQDMLFVDNSHRSFSASDVTVFFTEILPALPPGLIYGVHDICLPWDYPAEWKDRYYNEQYVLMMYILGGFGQDQILVPLYWAARQPDMHSILSGLWKRAELFSGLSTHGAALWARRGAAPLA